MNRFPLLDLVRLVAALEVVAMHAYNIDQPGRFQPYVQPVPLFVCLSGFLIPGSFERSKRWTDFAWKRACRVIPAFLASLLLVVCVSGASSVSSTLLQYATMGLIGASANVVLWSLSVEELLYGTHALKRSIKHAWRTETVLLCFVICAVTATLVHTDIRRILEASAAFFMGNVAYLHRKRISKLHWSIPLASTATAYYVINYARITPLIWQFGSALLCVSIVLLAWKLPQPKWEIPDFSYGIYVYHFPLLTLFAPVSGSISGSAPYAFAATLPMAVVSWYVIEKPALQWKDRPWQLPWTKREAALAEVAA